MRRLENNHLVALAHRGRHGAEQRLGGSRRDGYFGIGIYLTEISIAQSFCYCLAQFGATLERSIFGAYRQALRKAIHQRIGSQQHGVRAHQIDGPMSLCHFPKTLTSSYILVYAGQLEHDIYFP